LKVEHIKNFADDENVVCRANCWLENQNQKLVYYKT